MALQRAAPGWRRRRGRRRAAAARAPAGVHQRLRRPAGRRLRAGGAPRPGGRFPGPAAAARAAPAPAGSRVRSAGSSRLSLHQAGGRHQRRRRGRHRGAEQHLRGVDPAARRRPAAGLGLLRLRPRRGRRGRPPAAGAAVRRARVGGADARALVRALGGPLPAARAPLPGPHGAVFGDRRAGARLLASGAAPARLHAGGGVRHRGQPRGGRLPLPVRVPGVHARHPGLEQVRQDQLRLLRGGRRRPAPRGGGLAALHLRQPGRGRPPALPLGGVSHHRLGRGGGLLLRRTGLASLPLDRGPRVPGGAVPRRPSFPGARAGGRRPARHRYHDRLLRVLAERRPLARRQVRGPRRARLGRADRGRGHGAGARPDRGRRSLPRVCRAGAAAAGARAVARSERRLRFGRVERRGAPAAGDAGAVPAGAARPGFGAAAAARDPLSARPVPVEPAPGRHAGVDQRLVADLLEPPLRRQRRRPAERAGGGAQRRRRPLLAAGALHRAGRADQQ